ncbi:Uncharacterised protein [Serratia proteamaculans]|nr:Uncharacterised protein [Serratia proteamaculans]CAI1213232.1 Uncharacterised protein [Serratia proteamaculans]
MDQRSAYGFNQHIGINRFGKKIKNAKLERAAALFNAGLPGHQNHRQTNHLAAPLLQQHKPGLAGHANIQQQATGRCVE